MKTFFITLVGSLLLLSGALATAPFYSDIEDPIDNEYIVVLHSNVSLEERDGLVSLVERHGGVIIGKYFAGLKGFGSRMDEKILTLLLESPLVQFIERNARVSIDTCFTLTENVPWGLSRITHTGARNVDEYVYNDANGGSGLGVDVYVIDTGIQLSHKEFDGRAKFGMSSIPDETTDDCNGHGTHVAGTIGGLTKGVARDVTLIAVKVLSCEGSGSNNGVIQGIEFTQKDCKERGGENNKCVANMSLGGGKSTATNMAVEAAVEGGIIMVVAAGNENQDACKKSPASDPKAITVGATGEITVSGQNTDNRASFSNFGDCVDIFAPGVGIASSYIDVPGLPADSVYGTLSGTSMACPHVAGVAAQYLSHLGADAPEASDFLGLLTGDSDPDEINMECSELKLSGKRESCSHSPNKMLQSLSCSA